MYSLMTLTQDEWITLPGNTHEHIATGFQIKYEKMKGLMLYVLYHPDYNDFIVAGSSLSKCREHAEDFIESYQTIHNVDVYSRQMALDLIEKVKKRESDSGGLQAH